MAPDRAEALRERLNAVLTDCNDGSIRWDADVPIVSNLFILVDFLRCEAIMVLAVAAMAGIPQWFYGGGGAPQAVAILRLCAAGMFLLATCLFVVGFLVLRNRFHAVFVLNEHHIYCETRGRRKGGGVFLGYRPRVAEANDSSPRVFSREVPWNKADSFTSFPSMRTILVKRGIWEMVKLYMPDDETHEKVRAFLASRLRERTP